MGDGYTSEYIIRRKQKYILEIQNKGRMQFWCDSLLVHHKEKNEKIIYYLIEEWHKPEPYDIFRNVSYYPTVCLLLDTSHRTNHCIKVFGKWIFDSNFEVTFPLTQDCLNYICSGNDTDESIFVGVLHAIRSVPPKFVKMRLNMKS